jgi:hypothetical protein
MEFYFLNLVQLSCDFGKVVPSGTTQGKVWWVVTKSKNMFILNIELNNIFMFNILKATWWLLSIYVTRNKNNSIYHAWTPTLTKVPNNNLEVA